jgi:lipoprotein-anchoring transpeptidase ErfK/SrfK
MRPRRAGRLVSALSLALFLLSALLSACAPDTSAAADRAHHAQTRLDQEMQTARTHVHVPDSLLQPIVDQEHTLAVSTKSGTEKAYQDAATGYSKLYDKVIAIEHMTPRQARAQAQADLQRFTTSLQHVRDAGFVEAAQYQQGLQKAQQQLDAATTTTDYFTADGFIQAQTAAVEKIEPVYQQLQALSALVDARNTALGVAAPSPLPLQCARGSNEAYYWPNPLITLPSSSASQALTLPYQQWPADDLARFRAASSAAQYDALSTLINAQTMQLTADAAVAAPVEAQRLVQAFQADVQTYQRNGGKDGSFQQQAAQDAQALAAAKTPADYAALAQAAGQHRQAFALPLVQAQTQHDIQTLQQLVNKAQAIQTIDPSNNLPYPDGYEYASPATGIGDARDRLATAKTQEDFQLVDNELQMFITNIQAMLKNLDDSTPSDQPHQTDLSLMQHYGITGTRVVVVSLREQEARMYDNGKLVKTSQVTTGNPELPSPPGIHCVFAKLADYMDISPFPKSSPFYYQPTHINFGMYYSDYGYIVHDAWWRNSFGKYTNLPHYDPIAFNNGSHGCVNFPLDTMTWLYPWAQVGTPVLVY